MKIPSSYKMGGGKLYKVTSHDELDGKYGDFSDLKAEIRLAKNVDGEEVSDEDYERTFYHELIHCMNYLYNCDCDEALAQTFSNFLYEFMHTKQ